MSRIERKPIQGDPSFFGMQSILGVISLGILSEVLVKIPRYMIHSEPKLLDVDFEPEEKRPVYDKGSNSLTVQTETSVGLEIGTLKFAIIHAVGPRGPSAKIKINCTFGKDKNGRLQAKGGDSLWVTNSKLRVEGVDFTHKS